MSSSALHSPLAAAAAAAAAQCGQKRKQSEAGGKLSLMEQYIAEERERSAQAKREEEAVERARLAALCTPLCDEIDGDGYTVQVFRTGLNGIEIVLCREAGETTKYTYTEDELVGNVPSERFDSEFWPYPKHCKGGKVITRIERRMGDLSASDYTLTEVGGSLALITNRKGRAKEDSWWTLFVLKSSK